MEICVRPSTIDYISETNYRFNCEIRYIVCITINSEWLNWNSKLILYLCRARWSANNREMFPDCTHRLIVCEIFGIVIYLWLWLMTKWMGTSWHCLNGYIIKGVADAKAFRFCVIKLDAGNFHQCYDRCVEASANPDEWRIKWHKARWATCSTLHYERTQA